MGVESTFAIQSEYEFRCRETQSAGWSVAIRDDSLEHRARGGSERVAGVSAGTGIAVRGVLVSGVCLRAPAGGERKRVPGTVRLLTDSSDISHFVVSSEKTKDGLIRRELQQ